MSLKRNLSFTFLDKIVTFLIFLVTTMIVSRILTPAELGLLAISVSSIALITMFKNFGFTQYIIKEADFDSDKKASVLTLSLIVSTILFVIIILVADSIGYYYDNHKITTIIQLISITVLLSPLHILATGLLERNEQFKELAIVNIISEILFFVCVMTLIYYDNNVIGIAISNVFKSILQMTLMVFIIHKEMVFRLSLSKWRGVLVFGTKISLISIIYRLEEMFVPLIIGKVLGVASVAQYEKGKSLPKIIWQVLYPALHTAVFPHYARLNREGENLDKSILHNMQHGLAVFWPILLALALVSPSAIFYLYGEQWAMAVPVAMFLSFSSILTTPIMFIQMGLITTGNENYALVMSITTRLIIFLGIFIVVSHGINWVAGTMLFTDIIYFLISFFAAKKLGIKFYVLLNNLVKPVFVMLISNIPFFIIFSLWNITIVYDFYILFIASLAFLLLWIFSLFYLFPAYNIIINNLYKKILLIFSKIRA